MRFRDGQEVVCINAKPQHAHEDVSPLRLKKIYRVRWCGFNREGSYRPDELKVKLHGVVRRRKSKSPYISRVDDMPFLASRFRPLVEKKTETGMGLLEGLLKKTKVKATKRKELVS